MATTTATQIQQLYVGLLGRAADQGGLNWWADQVTTGGKTLEDVRASFVTSTEYTTTYGAAATRADLVTSIYQNLFERTPSADEVKYWAETDTRPADQLVAAFIEFAGAADQTVINNKTFVAQTYTDTAGTTNFNKAAAKTVIDDVNGTPASVTTAVAAISNGTLPGLVPGLAQINAVASKQAAVTAFEKATAVANPTFDTLKADGTTAGQDGSVSIAELNAAKNLATTAHDNAVGTGVTTATATATLKNLTDDTVAAKEAAVTASSVTAVGNLDAALAAEVAVKGTAADVAATGAAKASAIAGFSSALGASGQTTVTAATLDKTTLAAGDIKATSASVTTADVYTALTSSLVSATERAALVTEVNKLGSFGAALVAAADKEVAVTKAGAAVTAATAAVDGTGTTGTDYVAAAAAQKVQADLVAKAVTADAQLAAIKVAIDAHTALDTAVTKAIADVTALNSTKVAVSDLGVKTDAGAGTTAIAAGDVITATAKSDVFYFGATKAASVDFSIGAVGATFGAGDAIVLGSGYTFNAGALTAGHNDVSEFFLVQGATGVQIVLENSVFGSATATTAATGVVNASATDGVSVITLTGVSIDHVAVANGVVSYV